MHQIDWTKMHGDAEHGNAEHGDAEREDVEHGDPVHGDHLGHCWSYRAEFFIRGSTIYIGHEE